MAEEHVDQVLLMAAELVVAVGEDPVVPQHVFERLEVYTNLGTGYSDKRIILRS